MFPGINPTAFITSFPFINPESSHCIELKPPQPVPENNSNTGSIDEDGLTVIVAVVFTAVKLNQTSSSAFPVQPGID